MDVRTYLVRAAISSSESTPAGKTRWWRLDNSSNPSVPLCMPNVGITSQVAEKMNSASRAKKNAGIEMPKRDKTVSA